MNEFGMDYCREDAVADGTDRRPRLIPKRPATEAPPGVTQEHWELASRDARLGVGHTWTAMTCPAYRTLDPTECTCTTD